MAILVNSFPREQSGRVLGLCVMFTYIGLTLGPVVGGILTHNFGWHSIFIFTAIFSVIPLVSAIIGIPKKSLDNKSFKEISLKEINPVGILLYGSMIFAIMLGFTEIAETYYSWGIMVIGFILLFVFIKHEQKTSRPILELRLFRKNPQFVFSNLASFLNYGATFAVSYLLSVYFQIVLDFDAQIAGIILIIQPAIQALLSPIAGRLSDKYPPYIIATTGMAMCAIGLFSYIFVDHNSSPIHYTINLVVVGIGFGLFSSPNSHAIMSSIPPKDSSVASSMIATMRTLGHATSMAIITLIVGANLGNRTFAEASVAELEVTMRIAFIVFTCVCVLGIFCSLQRKRK